MSSFFDDLLKEPLPSSVNSHIDTDFEEGANLDAKAEFRLAMKDYNKYMSEAKTYLKKKEFDAASRSVDMGIESVQHARQIIIDIDYSAGSIIIGYIGQEIVQSFQSASAAMLASGITNDQDLGVLAAGLVTIFNGIKQIKGIVESYNQRGKLSISDFNQYKNSLVNKLKDMESKLTSLKRNIKNVAKRSKSTVTESGDDDFEKEMKEFDENDMFSEEDDDFESCGDGSECEGADEYEDRDEFSFAGDEDDDEDELDPDKIISGLADTSGMEFSANRASEVDPEIDDDLDDLANEVGVNGSIADDDISSEEDIHIPTSVDDPTPAKPVSAETDTEGDKMLAICATPTVLEDALTIEEAAEFLESGDSDIAIAEGFMMESDISQMIADMTASSTDIYTEGGVKFANPNQKYRMTKKAKLKQLYELSLQIEARLHHDPYYPKIQKAYQIERKIKEGWRKRYGALAAKRAKRYLKALMSSNSPTLRKAGKQMATK